MIVRILKLKPTKKQESILNGWLWNLTGLYNFAIKKIGNDANDKIYHSGFDCQNWAANHSKRMGIPSHVMQGILTQVYMAWQRCFKKLSKKPRLKGQRNKLNSIPFPDSIRPPKENKIKCGRVIKKASGWYLCLWLDCDHVFPVKETNKAVGIDPGFKTLLTLSDGTRFENPRELRKGAKRLAQAQRGKRKKLVARLQERQANRRNDRNHKISRKIIENYKTICYSNDNFRGMAKQFGKSITEAGLGDLIQKLTYKSKTCGRQLIAVNSKNTTLTCSVCGALTGPSGLDGLAVRHWECSACGRSWDRDYNSSLNILNTGLGLSLKESSNALN